jgi:hypothetical protein
MEAFKTTQITSALANGHSRSFTRCVSLVAMTGVVASALVCVQPVFALTDGGVAASIISTDGPGSPTVPNLGESSHRPTPPSLDGPALAPAPKDPVDPQWTPMLGGLMPEPPRSSIEPWVDPAIPVTSPMLTPPPGSMAMPGGGFYAPVR